MTKKKSINHFDYNKTAYVWYAYAYVLFPHIAKKKKTKMYIDRNKIIMSV